MASALQLWLQSICFLDVLWFSFKFYFNLNLLLICPASQSSCNWPHFVACCGTNGNVERSRKSWWQSAATTGITGLEIGAIFKHWISNTIFRLQFIQINYALKWRCSNKIYSSICIEFFTYLSLAMAIFYTGRKELICTNANQNYSERTLLLWQHSEINIIV